VDAYRCRMMATLGNPRVSVPIFSHVYLTLGVIAVMTLSDRRQWFEGNLPTISKAIPKSVAWRPTRTCSCCGYLTLQQRGAHEICWLCWWEDNGQDDSTADEVRGGPNWKYSLTEARRNFERYEREWLKTTGPRPASLALATPAELRRHMLSAFEEILAGSQTGESWTVISECREVLARHLSGRDRMSTWDWLE